MRSTYLALAIVLGAGCGEPAEEPPAEEVRTPLSGATFVAAPAAGALIRVVDFLEGGRGEVSSTTEADDGGAWSVDLGALGGDFLVEAETAEGAGLSSIVTGVEVDQGTHVVLSPTTHLATGYVRYLLSTGFGLKEAALEARRLFHVHFGRINQHAVVPEAVVDRTDEVSMLTPGVVSGILLAGLVELLEERSTGSTSAVLEALVRDIESDGVFDGRADGEDVGFGVDGQTLRTEYGLAIRRFLESDRNGTPFRAADLSEVLEEIETSRSELFSSGAEEADEVGPVLAELELLSGDTAVDPTRGVGGVLSLRASFEDPLGVESAQIEGPDGEVVEDRAPELDVISVSIDTRAMADGEVPFELVATDGAGNQTRMDLLLLVDNTPPVLGVDPAPVVSAPQVTITGTVTDDTSGVESVEVAAFGQDPVAELQPEEAFSVDVMIPCNVVEDLVVVARDRAGNEARQTIPVSCDDQPPRIELGASTFIQEGGMTVSRDGSGQVVYSSTAAETLTLGEGTSWPIRIEKFLNRLDEGAPNLPTIRFLADDPALAGVSSTVEVSYRYLVDGMERRPFAVLSQPSLGEPYQIAFSYQMLGPELGTAGPDALHRVEVVARDGAGNTMMRGFEFYVELLSPPVWVTDCGAAAELQARSLAAGNFHGMYGPAAVTDVMRGAVSYLLELPQGSLAPRGSVVLQPWPADLRTRIVELGEEKFHEPGSRDFVVSSLQELGNYCPFDTPGVYLNIGGAHERTRVSDQVTSCLQGLFPDGQTFATGIINDDVAHATSMAVLFPSGTEVPVGPGGVSVPADQPSELVVRMEGPSVTIGGVLFDWSTEPASPAGYIAAVAGAGTRYRPPLSAGLYHTGVDRWDRPNGAAPQERFFETRSYVRRVEVASAPVTMTARHSVLPDLEIDVRSDPSCSAPTVYSSQL